MQFEQPGAWSVYIYASKEKREEKNLRLVCPAGSSVPMTHGTSARVALTACCFGPSPQPNCWDPGWCLFAEMRGNPVTITCKAGVQHAIWLPLALHMLEVEFCCSGYADAVTLVQRK